MITTSTSLIPLAEGLTLHLRVEHPLDDLRIAGCPADERIAESAEEEIIDFLLVLHLLEYGSIGLVEGLILRNGAEGAVGCLEGIIEALARQLVGETASIADENDVVDIRLHRVQRDIGSTHPSLRHIEMIQCREEQTRVAGPVLVGIDVDETIHVAPAAGELVEASRGVLLGEMNEDVVIVLSLNVVLEEEGMHLRLAKHLLADHAIGTIGCNQIAARVLHA